jgi:putative hydrolase of the HAD superfamily
MLRAVLFDAGNTLLFLDYARRAAGVSERLAVPLSAATLQQGAAAAAQAMERRGTDHERARAFLDALFLEAGIPETRLGEVRECLGRLHGERHLCAAVPHGAVEALERLRAEGFQLGVVSNSDGRVESALEAAGLRRFFDVVIDSTLVGVEKPDPAIFHAALGALDVAPGEALYVGDLYEVDVVGARAAGMDAVLVGGTEPHPSGCRSLASVAAVVDDLLQGSLKEKWMVPR